MKKLLAILLALLALSAAALAEEAPALPAFEYQGGEKYMAEICAWLLSEEAPLYAERDVAIPGPVILDVDDSDPADIRVWGAFGLWWYELRGTTLFVVSGGALEGCLHLRAEGDGYVVASVDRTDDGDGYDESVERIFGARDGLIEKLRDSYAAREDAALSFAADYAKSSGLRITQRQDFGWAPVALPGAPETTEAEQRIHYVSTLGYSLDYDLRELSQDRYDDATECFSGVEALEGASIDVELREDAPEAVAEALAADMAEPERENVAFGADGLEAIRLRDAALAEGVTRETTLLAAPDGGTLIVRASNTYYASEDQTVPGADEVLAKTLATFRWEASCD